MACEADAITGERSGCSRRTASASGAASTFVVVPDSVRHLAYELTRGSLAEQEKRLSGLRTHAGTILAAASIAGSFLAAKNGSIDTLAILAIVAYIACVGAAVYVLLPHELVLEFRGSVVNELEDEHGGGLEAAYEAVTEWMEGSHDSNADKLQALGRWYTTACAALGAEVLLWTLSVTVPFRHGQRRKPQAAFSADAVAQEPPAWVRDPREARRI